MTKRRLSCVLPKIAPTAATISRARIMSGVCGRAKCEEIQKKVEKREDLPKHYLNRLLTVLSTIPSLLHICREEDP